MGKEKNWGLLLLLADFFCFLSAFRPRLAAPLFPSTPVSTADFPPLFASACRGKVSNLSHHRLKTELFPSI
jgi:hypothetical protein